MHSVYTAKRNNTDKLVYLYAETNPRAHTHKLFIITIIIINNFNIIIIITFTSRIRLRRLFRNPSSLRMYHTSLISGVEISGSETVLQILNNWFHAKKKSLRGNNVVKVELIRYKNYAKGFDFCSSNNFNEIFTIGFRKIHQRKPGFLAISTVNVRLPYKI